MPGRRDRRPRRRGGGLSRCAGLGHVALLLTILAGCHGGPKTDVVEREMRWQEDQIYAMEDYLSQYQQLLCECRQENARLRRQLGQREAAPPTSPGSTEGPTPWSPERSEGPAMGVPGPAAPAEIEPEVPEVPPLETSQQRIELWEASPTPISRQLNSDHPSATESPPTATHAPSDQPGPVVVSVDEPEAELPPIVQRQSLPVAGPAEHVWLYGEVFPGDDEAGARLLVDVEPLARAGRPAEFAGTLSLMVLDPDGEPASRSLARWDFTPDQLQQAVGELPDGRAMRFRLQLPADVAVERPVELWVRLLGDGGGRLLAHVELDLRKPGPFSSIRRPAPADRQVARQTDGRLRIELPLTVSQRPGWSQWQIARPGESGALAQRSGRPEGKWQAAAEAVPTVVRQSPPTPPAVVPASAELDASVAPTRTEAAPPGWSPDRPNSPSAPPAWSPTR